MTINGVVIVDMQNQLPSSIRITVQEKRGPGQIAPGFDGKTSLDMRISSTLSTTHLSDRSLAMHTKGKKIRQRLKWTSKLGSFVLKFDPRWKMIASEEDAAVLRLMDNGQLITQCNVVLLPKRPASKPISIEDYKKQVQQIVASDKNARLVDAETKTTESGNAAIRVVVEGLEEGVPIQWTYYHVSTTDGRQITFVFTLESSLSERVDVHADRLVNEFKFNELKASVAKTPANRTTSRK